MAEHMPTLLQILVERDCVAEACGHGGDCPTRTAKVCMDCSETEPVIGEVAMAARWPCSEVRRGR